MHFKIALCATLLSACTAIPTTTSRTDNATALAEKAGWQSVRLPTGKFVLTSFVPSHTAISDTLTVYIEGDGFAWVTSSQVSTDPTPVTPVALQLALNQPSGAAAYLARPCQYVMNAGCEKIYWTSHRFAPEVITATNLGIDALKLGFHAQKLVLIGYSGGGAVAALAAARRNDVIRLITVAGNLDHAAWTKQHHITPLSGSLNAADEWQALQYIPQMHFVGGQDKVVNREIIESYVARYPNNQQPKVHIIKDFEHQCCWAERWHELYLETLKLNM